MQDTTPETVGFRLSPQQEQLLSSPEPGAVSQSAAWLDGSVEPDRLRAALERVVAHHESLRTTFAQPAGMRTPQQVIADECAPAWRVLEQDTADVHALLEAERKLGFDLAQGPLLRALLVVRDEDRALLVLTAVAAVADAASLLVVLRELLEIHGGASAGEDPIQYADYAQWRHELISEAAEEGEAERGRAFWRDDAAERPQPPRILFETGSPRGAATQPLVLDSVDLEALHTAATASGVTAAVFLEAAWHALLARLSGASELLIASWLDGRGQPDLEQAVGPYAQPVPVRSQVQETTTFAEVLDQVRRARATGARWQDWAGAEELAALVADAGAGFAVTAAGPEVVSLSAPASSAPLTLGILTAEGRLAGELRYDQSAIDDAEAHELAGRYPVLLGAAVADAAQPVSRLPILLAGERERLTAGAGAPRAHRSDQAVHHQFEAQAARNPDLPAIDSANGTLSYAELDAAANRLAHHLRASGVAPGAIVGLALERTPALLVAVTAIHKAGAAYLPLNFEHPPARLRHQLHQSAAEVLVTEEHLLGRLPAFEGATVCMDRDRAQIDSHPSDGLGHQAGLEDLAYVMYTSGSTGLPKGVAVTHGNLANYSASLVERLGPLDGLRCGVVSAISTDLGNTCIFPPLTAGGCVQLISVAASMDADALASELAGRRLDVVKLTPSHLRALLDTETPAVLPRRWLVLGGEALRWELVERVRELSPECRILNHYGPTETTVGCCSYALDGRRADTQTVPIGRPLAGAWAYVLDQNLEAVPAGVPGELCIGGAGVARGYVGDPEGGTERFVADPFADGSRIYRTGDRARQLRDGEIEFLGRLDEQVKIRGFRIEPGEIESVLVSHPDVRQAAVSAEDDGHGGLRLVAYLVAAGSPTVEKLEAFLAQSLPDYMIPAAFATVTALPFTPSGKVDRKALPGLAQVQGRREAEYVAPRDEIEQQIAEIWRELLGVERVGVLDDFFALGGHSLLATQAIMRIRRVHGDIPLRALLAAPTVASLAEVVRANSGAS